MAKSLQIFDDPSWTCHGESFLIMYWFAKYLLVFYFIATFSFLLSVMYLCVLYVILSLALCSYLPFPYCSNVHAHLFEQSGILDIWACHLFVFCQLLIFSFCVSLPLILRWPSHISSSSWLFIQSSSLLSCSFSPCGLLIHAPLWFHESMVPIFSLYCYSWSCR